MNELEFKILLTIKKYGVMECFSYLKNISEDIIKDKINEFYNKKWIDNNSITEIGIKQLEPFKVDNAIIMSAGLSSRFVPLSIEKPKGLLVVKGEILIERQIEQLQAAGIENIIIVLGYKHEYFMYLKEKYSNITFIYNPKYNDYNNTYTIYTAKDYLKNSYICSSDNYFTENPFENYVYESYYSAIRVNEKTNEWYMKSDNNGYIDKISKNGNQGFIMLGHSYWNKDFSKNMLHILEDDIKEAGKYKKVLWEDVLADNLSKLPPMKIKEYPKHFIFEFDSLDELRKFDSSYIDNSNSTILDTIADFFDITSSEINSINPIEVENEKYSFSFKINQKKYVYTHNSNEDTITSENKETWIIPDKKRK